MVYILRQIQSESPEATSTIAVQLAAVLRPGDTLLLEGPIGAGKSHFARSAIQFMLSEPEDIPSPTYTLIQTYLSPRGEIWHADLYRMANPSEVYELGLWSAFEDAICLVEWPDRLGTEIPGNALTLNLATEETDGDTRTLRFSSGNPEWDYRLQEVLSA